MTAAKTKRQPASTDDTKALRVAIAVAAQTGVPVMIDPSRPIVVTGPVPVPAGVIIYGSGATLYNRDAAGLGLYTDAHSARIHDLAIVTPEARSWR